MTAKIAYDEGKLTELILYIGARCGLDEHYGVLKLNKILFYSDFKAFKTLGRPITGVEYRKYTHGPAPAVMKVLKQKLERNKDVFEYHNPLPNLDADDQPMSEKRLLPRREPVITRFTAEQIAIVDEVIDWLRPKTGKEVSVLTHRHPGWRHAEMGSEIPYCTALLSETPKPLSAADLKRARATADRFGTVSAAV